MDIAGYLFVGVAIIFVVYGLIDGLVHSLLTAVALVGSMAAGVLLTPTIANLEFVKKLIEDTPVIIGGQEICFLRMVIVFFALFVLSLLSCLIVRGLLKGILKRVKILKLIDRLLGASLNATIAWALFGVLFALANSGTGWLVAIEEQLATSGIQLGLANTLDGAFASISNSPILQMVYSVFNPIGDIVLGILMA